MFRPKYRAVKATQVTCAVKRCESPNEHTNLAENAYGNRRKSLTVFRMNKSWLCGGQAESLTWRKRNAPPHRLSQTQEAKFLVPARQNSKFKSKSHTFGGTPEWKKTAIKVDKNRNQINFKKQANKSYRSLSKLIKLPTHKTKSLWSPSLSLNANSTQKDVPPHRNW